MNTLENELKFIETEKIDFDSQNPRSEKAENIIRDPLFQDLKKSIQTYNILEPLFVKKHKNGTFEYVLIDGERRLRAAKDLKLERVPSLVVESEAEGKILAYQIHMLRKIWSKIAEAKSIKGIINDIKVQNPDIDNKGLYSRIKNITNAPDDKVDELLYLTLYDDENIEQVLNKDIKISYLIETEKVLIPKLKRNYVEIISKYNESGIRSIIPQKARANVLGETRFLRKDKKNKDVQFIDVLDNIYKSDKASTILDEFFSKIKMSVANVISNYKALQENSIINDVDSEGVENNANGGKSDNEKTTPTPPATTTADNKSNTSSSNSSTSNNGQASPNNDYAQIKLTQVQQTSIADIRKKYDGIGKTFSKEELEYIKEAIICLHNGCLKAATLMIWSAFISRTLNFINKDLPKFNQKSSEMHQKKQSFYKHWADNFKCNVSDIESIREASRDMQILCYICYIGIIDKTQFDKFKNYYQYRNNCAHPTTVVLNPNEVIVLFELIYEHIFINQKLKI